MPEVSPAGAGAAAMSKPPSAAVQLELEDRDPNNLNRHLQIVWEEIIGEPTAAGARSPECAWRLSALAFRHARNLCYTLMAVLLAPPAAVLLGCCFACLAFEQIWCSAPCLRALKICCASTRTSVRAAAAALVAPVAEAVGLVCRHVRVQQRRDERDEPDVLLV